MFICVPVVHCLYNHSACGQSKQTLGFCAFSRCFVCSFCKFGGFGGISPSICNRYCFFLRQNLTVGTPARTRRVPCPRTRGSCGYFGLSCAEAGSIKEMLQFERGPHLSKIILCFSRKMLGY